MKKVLFVFAIAATFAACNDSSKSEAPKTDSVAPAKTDSVAPKTDSVVAPKTDSVAPKADTSAKKTEAAPAKH